MEDSKPLFESKHCLSLKCVLFLFYGGLGCIYPFLQSNMAHKGFDFNEIYSISVIIPIAALFGPLVFAVLVDKWATTSAFAYGKRVRILTAVSLIASIVLYVILMFGVSRMAPPEICAPRVNFMCNKKGAYLMQEKCTAEGICHDWDHNKAGLLSLEDCTYSCQREVQFDSTCYGRQEVAMRLATLPDQEDDDDQGAVVDESETVRVDEGSGEGGTPNSNDLDGDGIPNDQDPDDDNDGIPDTQDNDDDNDGVPDAEDMDDDNDGIPDSMDVDSKMVANDLDGDGIPNDQDDDDDNDGIPDAEDDDDDNDGILDAKDDDDDNDGVPDSEDTDAKSRGNDFDGDGIPNDEDDDDDNDGIPDTEDQDDDNDGIPDAEDVDDDNDGIPDVLDANSRKANDLDGDGIPNDQDDDDDNDGIKDADDNDDDNDGIPDAVDIDDDNDGILDKDEDAAKYAPAQICHDPAVDNSDEDLADDEECYTYSGKVITVKASIDEHNERDDVEECIYPLDGFKCHIDKAWIKDQEQGCKPVIECTLRDPYSDNSSLLYGTTCDGDEDNDGDDDRGDSTYYFYLSIRSLLDFFLLAALTLFNTIIVIVTRDSSTGIADFGRQLVWGAIGWIIFFNDDYEQPYFWFIILNTIAAVILLSPLQMDLSPPEEWWKFKSVPQKFFSSPSFIKYAKLCWLPFLITILLGSLWSIIDSIDKSHMIDVPKDDSAEEPVFRTVFRTLLLAGDLLAIPVLIFSQRIIATFGTCKIFVVAFLALVVRFILLAIFDWEYWDIIEDALLPATLGLTWVTLVLHFRDVLPHKVTAIAQSLPVIAHFGFGRFFGALIGIEYDYDNLENDYEIIAGVLFAITIISIVLYRYREFVLNYVGQYIPALKPCENEKVVKVGKGETDV
ncbi:uncharacterized protein LOC135707568 isoform X4 [Ochlerotatus camptorhynchus]|uniref:uncharacterized protein LOC135707568 isoform X4 n=1 Tax=Ochlerotatus camptorhynchus TaxID=644619 RepID=UPI0031E46043